MKDTTPAATPAATTPETHLVAERPRLMGRWDSNGDTWHSHAVVHAHTAGDKDHEHLFATSETTLAQLQHLLRRASIGELSETDRRAAADLLKLTR